LTRRKKIPRVKRAETPLRIQNPKKRHNNHRTPKRALGPFFVLRASWDPWASSRYQWSCKKGFVLEAKSKQLPPFLDKVFRNVIKKDSIILPNFTGLSTFGGFLFGNDPF
jgi:hypothetical protein